MSKASLFEFLIKPGEMVRGVRKLGARGAVLQGVRRASASVDRAVLGPGQLRINPVGAVCNHTCPMCWLQQKAPDEKKRVFREDRAKGMTLEDYVRFFDTAPRGITEVNVVGGGEPLVHRECVEIMRDVKRRGWRGYLISNGTLLDEDKARALVKMGWDRVRVSTHAGTAATYEQVQGVDHFERLRSNLQTYDRLRREAGAERRCALDVHHVLQRENLGEIDRMVEFAMSVGADHVVFELIFALSDDKRLTPDELEGLANDLRRVAATAPLSTNALDVVANVEREHAETSAELAAAAAATEAAAEAPPEPSAPEEPLPAPEPAAASEPAPAAEPVAASEPVVGSGPTPDAEPELAYRPAARCSVGFDSCFVNSNGDVVPCCFSNEVMGNVREQSFKEVWYGEKYEDFRTRLINGKFAQYCSDVRCKLTSFLHD